MVALIESFPHYPVIVLVIGPRSNHTQVANHFIIGLRPKKVIIWPVEIVAAKYKSGVFDRTRDIVGVRTGDKAVVPDGTDDTIRKGDFF